MYNDIGSRIASASDGTASGYIQSNTKQGVSIGSQISVASGFSSSGCIQTITSHGCPNTKKAVVSIGSQVTRASGCGASGYIQTIGCIQPNYFFVKPETNKVMYCGTGSQNVGANGFIQSNTYGLRSGSRLQAGRGSGTIGCIESNKCFLRPKTTNVINNSITGTVGVPQRGDKEILDQDHKRQTRQLKLRVLKEMLIDKGCTDSAISELLDEARKLLELKDNALVTKEKFSETQTHQISGRKEDFQDNVDGNELRSIEKKDVPDVQRQHGKGARDEKDYVRKIVKENGSGRDASKRRNKETSRKHDALDSDSIVKLKEDRSRKDSSRKKVVRLDSSSNSESQPGSEYDSGSGSDYRKKFGKSRRWYGSTDDVGERLKGIFMEKISKSKWYDSVVDGFDEDRKRKSKISKSKQKDRYDRYSSDDGARDRQKGKGIFMEKTSKSKWYDSVVDNFDEDRERKSKTSKSKQKDCYDRYSSDDGARDCQKGKKTQKIRNFDNEYNSDEGPENTIQKSKKLLKSRHHYSDDEVHADRYEKDERSQSKRRTNKTHRPDSPRDNRRKRQRDDTDDDGEQERNSRRNRKYDSGGDDDRKSDDSIERDRENDKKHARVNKIKSRVTEAAVVTRKDSGASDGKKDYLREFDHMVKKKE